MKTIHVAVREPRVQVGWSAGFHRLVAFADRLHVGVVEDVRVGEPTSAHGLHEREEEVLFRRQHSLASLVGDSIREPIEERLQVRELGGKSASLRGGIRQGLLSLPQLLTKSHDLGLL